MKSFIALVAVLCFSYGVVSGASMRILVEARLQKMNSGQEMSFNIPTLLLMPVEQLTEIQI